MQVLEPRIVYFGTSCFLLTHVQQSCKFKCSQDEHDCHDLANDFVWFSFRVFYAICVREVMITQGCTCIGGSGATLKTRRRSKGSKKDPL